MSRFRTPKFSRPGDVSDDPTGPPPLPSGGGFRSLGLIGTLLVLLLAAGVIYSGYFWLIRRVVVGPDEVLVLLKKDGSRSLPADQIVIPRPPEKPQPNETDQEKVAAWKE